MRSIGDVLRDFDPLPLTPRQQQAVDEVYEMCDRYVDGTAELTEVRAATTTLQRRLAARIRVTPPNHPKFLNLHLTIDALCRDDPTAFVTDQGILDVDEVMGSYGRVVSQPDGRRLLQFPLRQPWRIKPLDGAGGERGEPVYRRPEDKPTRTELPQRELEWWEV